MVYSELLKPLKKTRLKKEIEIVIVLDNYPVHNAKILKKTYKYLNITLIHLPPYSPKLNPIEQVWRTIKKKNYPQNLSIMKNF
ncbi:transposase [Methanobrevibacter cuticularis]|uniref:transposase n=1 Tax=Methanobrevibacter cuticularis TaxID=47311 RepID=UPI00373FCE7D